ncbi:SHOCT domain-containing protein [Nocardioides alcanivorans]|uniref:SHOCT domain-containing protein n=1 Tax=Nocardioides alcanivorans TaxID=2897352 RepID=UPI001F1BAD14|nr:SHOCT domain-containing protein [Nocardioides alcanivorans]
MSNRVSRRQAGRWAAQAERQPPVQYAPAPYAQQPAPGAADTETRLAQLKELGELQAQGVLSPAEFAAEKAKILNS